MDLEKIFEEAQGNQFSRLVFCDGVAQTHITKLTNYGLITKVVRQIDDRKEPIYYKH